MRFPEMPSLVLAPGILIEPAAVGQRLIVWIPGEVGGGYRRWERVGSQANASVAVEAGICTTPASSIPTKQRIGPSFGKLFDRLRGSRDERFWTLPNGELVEQAGERRSDLLLAWGEDGSTPIHHEQIQSRWGGTSDVRTLGPGLFLVSGIETAPSRLEPAPNPEPATASSDGAVGRAQRELSEARSSGDRARCSRALADLGLAYLQKGDISRGSELIESALLEARESGDREQETAVLIDLGMAFLSRNQPTRAIEHFEEAATRAQKSGDLFLEKAALHRLGQAAMSVGNHVGALGYFERALALAAKAGDRSFETELLWSIGLEHAELGHRDRALAMTQVAVDRLRRAGHPKAEWYAHHLARFRSGDLPGSDLDSQQGRGPGPLRMAFTAAAAMTKFIGSGFKTASPDVSQARNDVCAVCRHHTGLRCRLCGCFTEAKVRLIHERCPIGKWSA